MEGMPLVVRDDFGLVQLSDKVADLIDQYKLTKEKFLRDEEEFRSTLLKAMIDNGIVSAKIGNWNIAQAVPKPIETFNAEEFLLNEVPDLTSMFCKITETKEFNIEKLKEKYPDIYKECCDIKTDYTIDEKKLKKSLPELYRKYITVTQSDRQITLKISEVKNNDK